MLNNNIGIKNLKQIDSIFFIPIKTNKMNTQIDYKKIARDLKLVENRALFLDEERKCILCHKMDKIMTNFTCHQDTCFNCYLEFYYKQKNGKCHCSKKVKFKNKDYFEIIKNKLDYVSYHNFKITIIHFFKYTIRQC